MLYSVVTILATLLVLCSAVCKTNNGEECVFPFLYKNTTYAGCTDDKDPDGKYWCSTMVDSLGQHVKSSWGHCQSDCPTAADMLTPDCQALVVTDQDQDFSSGVYKVDKTRTVLGRVVYINTDKDLFIFWLPNNAGWGVGYESGLSSGGSFYSSGPEVVGEPWLGVWAEPKLQVWCSVDLPFLDNVSSLPQTTRTCSDTESCLARHHCPAVERSYQQLLGKRKDDPASIVVARMLKRKVCNTRLKGFCCAGKDDTVCKESQSCRTMESCPDNRRMVETIRGNSLHYTEAARIYRELRGRVCDSRRKMLCCEKK